MADKNKNINIDKNTDLYIDKDNINTPKNRDNGKISGKTRPAFSFGSSIIIFIVFIVVGIIISVQIKAVDENHKKIEAQRTDLRNYIEQLEKIQSDTQELENSLNELQARKDLLLEATLIDLGYTQIYDELQRVNRLAGFTEISGPGITVMLNDRLVEDSKYPAITSVIHEADIRQVVDIMRSGGARGISINGERVVSTSEITCNGPTVQINKKKFPVPYIISCVGDTATIKMMLTEDEWLNGRILSNIDLKIKTEDNIIIPGFGDRDRISGYIDSLKG